MIKKTLRWLVVGGGVLLGILFVGFSLFIFQEELVEGRIYLWSHFSKDYEADKALIKPYFDETFYRLHYAEQIRQSGLSPIDHYLQKGWYSRNWRKHTDPNAWFNTTLYQERLWGERPVFWKAICPPLVDFLKQPAVGPQAQTLDVYAREDELARAWLAVEGLMRLKLFNIVLHLPEPCNTKVMLERFTPQMHRGLRIEFDNIDRKSFYQNKFLTKPDAYHLTPLTPTPKADAGASVSYVQQDFPYLMHRLYNYTNWFHNDTRLNPMMINVAHNSDEPLVFIRFNDRLIQLRKFLKHLLLHGECTYPAPSPQDFKDYMMRIGEGFDLCLLNTKLPLPNVKVVPGFLFTAHMDERELDKNKTFSVSYLLSLGGKSFSNYRMRDGFAYDLRNDVWECEKNLKVPTKFYISYRDKKKFPKNVQHRVLPTPSKKWVLNSQFTIAVENSMQEDYLSEKLLGCFVGMSVPIYIGCPNVTDYFDPRGMIIVHSVEELTKAVNALTPETYQKMLPYLKENRRRAFKILELENNILKDFGRKLEEGSSQ